MDEKWFQEMFINGYQDEVQEGEKALSMAGWLNKLAEDYILGQVQPVVVGQHRVYLLVETLGKIEDDPSEEVRMFLEMSSPAYGL